MKSFDATSCAQVIISKLKAGGIQPQARGEMRSTANFPSSMMPKPAGQSRLIDGTVILVSGERNVMGDTISKTIEVDGMEVIIDAIGIAAVRLNKQGEVEAIAGGGMKSFRTKNFYLTMPERIDLAIFKEDGKWRGIVHGFEGTLPEALTKITDNWIRVSIPETYKMK